MKPFCFCLLLCLGSFQLLAQEIERPKIPKPKGDRTCVHKNRYDVRQRNSFYPFSIADSIKLISFRYHSDYYPLDSNKMDMDSMIEAKALSISEIDRLTDILYNYGYKKRPNYGVVTQCFAPRNAVVFQNHSGELLGYILLCFHCRNYETSSEEIQMGDNCDRKMELLRQFFVASGFKFGTDLSIDAYPGESTGKEVGIVPPPH